MKRTCSLTLLFALILSTFSCGDAASATGTTSLDETTETPVETSLFDTLPDEDFGGAEFRMLVPTELDYEFAEEQTGDIVDDAEYARDRLIEERYNVNLAYTTEPGNWAGKDTFNGLIKQSVMAGDEAFDLINGMVAVANLIVMDGVFTNLLTAEGLDFSAPWWAANMDTSLTVSGKLFGICGAGQLSMYKSAYIMFYNQKLLDDYKLADPIDIVLDGKWTLDTFLSMTKDITKDLDSDGSLTKEDQYGYLFDDVTQRGYQTSMELKVIDRGADGKLKFVGLSERLSNAVDIYHSHISDKTQVFHNGGTDAATEERIKMFVSDQALFAGETIGRIERYRDMESDFGMIPLTKYDETQTEYHTQIGTGSGMYFIPKTAKNVDMTVSVMNAFNCISMETVVPTYYESALKVKYIRDERNKAVIDLINSSMSMDVTFCYATTIGGNINQIFASSTIKDEPIASTIASNESVILSGIETMESAFAAIE